MTIFIPFVPGMFSAATYEWARARTDVEASPIAEGDYTAYWRLLNYVWTLPIIDDLTIVEHDMLPADGVIEEMVCCPQPWCTSPYRCDPRKDAADLTDGLGCVNFSKALRLAHPEVMRVVSCIADDGVPAKDWRRLDVRMARVLRSFGYEPHVHERSIHLHYERP